MTPSEQLQKLHLHFRKSYDNLTDNKFKKAMTEIDRELMAQQAEEAFQRHQRAGRYFESIRELVI